MTTCEPSPPNVWPQMELELTLSAAASPAKTFRRLAWGPEWTANGLACGPITPVSLARFCPEKSSWRTSEISFQAATGDGSDEFSATWPRSGMMRSGIAYQLPTLAPSIRGTGFGLWQSPLTAYDGRSEAAWVLAKARAHAKHKAGLYKKGTGPPGMVDLRRAALRSVRASRELLPNEDLNPRWVEQLLGFPAGWLNIAPSETP